MTPITYYSEQPADYAKGLTEADTLDKLRAFARDWRELAPDAFRIVASMTEVDFKSWRVGLVAEREGMFAGAWFAKQYGALMIPTVLFKVSQVASRFGVPWGCAYIRLRETGNLERLEADAPH